METFNQYQNYKKMYLELKKQVGGNHVENIKKLNLHQLKMYLLDNSESIENLSIKKETYEDEPTINNSDYSDLPFIPNHINYSTITTYKLFLNIKFKGIETFSIYICDGNKIDDIGLYFLMKKYDRTINTYVSRELDEKIKKFFADQKLVNGIEFDETDDENILLKLSKYDFIPMFASKRLRSNSIFLLKIADQNRDIREYILPHHFENIDYLMATHYKDYDYGYY